MADSLCTALFNALSGNADSSLLVVCIQLDDSTPDQRRSVLSSLGNGVTWGSLVCASLSHPEEETSIWNVVAALTDLSWNPQKSKASVRPPPLRDMVKHFSDPSFLAALIDGLSIHRTVTCQVAACRCLRNLGRVPKLRSMLQDSIEPLVRALSARGNSICGSVAAALCNVACTASGKAKAVNAGAVPLLLAALKNEQSLHIADDLAASIGVLTNNFMPGAEAVIAYDFGMAPLLEALRVGCPVPAATVLGVLSELAFTMGPMGDAVARLATDADLVSNDLPYLIAQSDPTVRRGALKLCALLLDFDGFRKSFIDNGGVQAIQTALELEPPAPPVFAMPVVRDMQGKVQLCSLGCVECSAEMSCLEVKDDMPQRPPTSREIAEQLFSQLSS